VLEDHGDGQGKGGHRTDCHPGKGLPVATDSVCSVAATLTRMPGPHRLIMLAMLWLRTSTAASSTG
jgi:hypothetical protein